MADGTGTSQEQTRSRGGVDVSTLIVAALASLAAAFVTSRLWASGTLISTAMTPVIVSLLKEWLQRPVEKVGEAAKAPLVAVRAVPVRGAPAGARSPGPPETERRGRVVEPHEPDLDEYERLETLVPPGEEGSGVTPYRVYRKRSRRRTWWAVGLASGALAFVVAVITITVPEIVGGGSVGGTGRTTLFSHHTAKAKKPDNGTSTEKSATTKSTPADQPTTSTSPSNSLSTTTPRSTTTQSPTETTPTAPQSSQTRSAPTQTAPTQTAPAAPPSAGGG